MFLDADGGANKIVESRKRLAVIRWMKSAWARLSRSFVDGRIGEIQCKTKHSSTSITRANIFKLDQRLAFATSCPDPACVHVCASEQRRER